MKKIVVLGLVCLLAGAAHAVLIAWDNFDYEEGLLGGNNGGDGWTGAWSGNSFAEVFQPVTPLSYAGGDVVVNGGSSAMLWTGNSGSSSLDMVSRGLPQQTRTVYISFLAQLVSGSWGNLTHTLVGYIEEKGGNNTETGPLFGPILQNNHLGSAVLADTWTDAGNSAPSPGQTYLIVGKLTWDDDVNAFVQSDIWINPTSTTTESGFHGMKDGKQAIAGGMDGLDIAVLDLLNTRTMAVDQIRIGTRWVNVVPEPTTMGMLVLVGATAYMIRRRRNSIA